MMQRIYIIIVSIFLPVFSLAQTFRTQPLVPNIKTIQVNAMGDWNKLPIIDLGTEQYIKINFDYLSENDVYRRLRYNIYHCDANWQLSKHLSEIDYLDGFNNNLIEDYTTSLNTTVDYRNYNLEIPNKNVKLKLSGNYVVSVFDEDEPEKILLTACFSISEPIAKIGYNVSTITNIDANKAHQQVSLYITPNVRINNPLDELKLFVRQNNRLDSERKNLKPQIITSNQITYDQNRDLIFEAGNEYRRFETSTTKSNGMNIVGTRYTPPYYFADIMTDNKRSMKGYIYDQDQNGAYLIRTTDHVDYDTEADYVMTTFTLSVDRLLLEDIFLNGEFTYNSFDENYRMQYDAVNKEYKLSLLLKQGLYNYQYLTNTMGRGYSTEAIEGNYYQTENQYSVYLYYCPSGQRYDRMIGSLIFFSHTK